MDLVKNNLVIWKSEEASSLDRTERILGVNPERDEIWVIEMLAPDGMPRRESLSRYRQDVAAGLAMLGKSDPWMKIGTTEGNTPTSTFRDENWELIRPIVEHRNCLIKKARSPLIKAAAKKSSKRKIYELLRRYWRGGQTKEALAPRFDLRGGPGKTRDPNARRGQVGKALTQEDRDLMTRGFQQFFVKETRPSMTKAYDRMCGRFYTDGFVLNDGLPVPSLKPPGERPSLRQFRYHVRDLLKLPKTLRDRIGDRKFELQERELPGRFRSNGPGSLFMIDATKGDIYVASTYLPGECAGRATIYLVVDHFSGAVAGFHIGFESASARMAGLALATAACDKVEFAARYGVEIAREDWPCQHLPAKLLADQGELRGPIAEPWITELGIELRQTPTNRADLKGAVERCFQSLGRNVLEGLPGYVERDRARRDKDPARYAKLTLHELTALIIRWVVEYNTRARTGIRNDDLPAEAGLTPAKLWAWGVVNRGSDLKGVSQEIAQVVALPKGQARVTREGIVFRGTCYWCAEAEAGDWNFINRGRPLDCHYDENDAGVLYIVVPGGHVTCHLRHENDIAHHRSWHEINLIRSKQRETARKDAEISTQHKVARETHGNAMLKGKPKGRGSRANIRANRDLEVANQRISRPPAPAPKSAPRPAPASTGQNLAATRLAMLDL